MQLGVLWQGRKRLLQLQGPSPSPRLGMRSLNRASAIHFCIAFAGWLDCPSSNMIELEAYAVGLRETLSIFPSSNGSRVSSVRCRQNCGRVPRRDCLMPDPPARTARPVAGLKSHDFPLLDRHRRGCSLVFCLSRRTRGSRGRGDAICSYPSDAVAVVPAPDGRYRVALPTGGRHYRWIYRRGFRRANLLPV